MHTGDLATMDENGYCNIVGRIKDMVIRGGENVYPREIEDVLAGHPAVSEVAVVGAPDATWGEEVAAVVRTGAAHSTVPAPQDLFDFCRERLAGYKCPRLWFYVTDFPTTASGKVQKHRLVRMIADGKLEPVASFQRTVSEPPTAGR
jgi:acyl-CoA synthetase (AMP-forming)/AMP-acid ligase II